MISENLLRWRQYPHLVAMPGITLAVAVFGFNFLGDGINDAMNPKQIRR
jgi:peptide/nickel transport system permease protein